MDKQENNQKSSAPLSFEYSQCKHVNSKIGSLSALKNGYF